MRRYLMVIIFLILFYFGMRLLGVHIYPSGTLPGKVETLMSYNIKNGKGILFEDKKNNSFGIAVVKKYGPIYFFEGGTDSHMIEEGMPFSVAGYGEVDGDFMVAIKVPESSNIKFFTLGNHLEPGDPLNETVSLEIVKKHSDSYLLKEIEGSYAFFLTNGYSERSWTVRGFNGDGNLIAEKPFGLRPRYVQ